MNRKRFLSFFITVIFIASLTACNTNEDVYSTQESTSVSNVIVNETVTENILNVEIHKANTEKRNSGKKIGCLGGCFSLVAIFLLWFILDCFVFSVLFVASEKPYLVASDYSSITYKDNVYVRIEELPENAYPATMFGATIWNDSRTDGLSKWDQSMQGNKVQLFEDDEGREYLWLVEDYVDNILAAKDNGEDKDYEDFDEHYVYVCENP